MNNWRLPSTPRRINSSTFSAPGRSSKKVITALAFPLFEQGLKSGWFAAKRAAETADKFWSERLQNEAVLLLEKSDLGARSDRILAAKLRGDDQLAFGGDSGNFSLHARSMEYNSR